MPQSRRVLSGLPAEPAPARRGLILLTLHAQYPHALLRRSLEQFVAGAYGTPGQEATAELTRDLAYLEERGLLRVEEEEIAWSAVEEYGRRLSPPAAAALRPAPPTTVVKYFLTPDGDDVVRGLVTLEGVHVAQPVG